MASPTADLRDMEYSELESRLAETRHELFNLRFQLVTGQLDNTARVGHVRKEIARISTIMREKEIAAAEALLERPEAPQPTEPTTATEAEDV